MSSAARVRRRATRETRSRRWAAAIRHPHVRRGFVAGTLEGLYGSLSALVAAMTDPGTAAEKVVALWATLKGMLSGIAGHSTAELVSTDVAMHGHGHGHGHGSDDPAANSLVAPLAAAASATGLVLGTVGPVATQLITQNPLLAIGANAAGLFALGATVIARFKGLDGRGSWLKEGWKQLKLGAYCAGFFYAVTEGIESLARSADLAALVANGVLPTIVALPLTIGFSRWYRRLQERRGQHGHSDGKPAPRREPPAKRRLSRTEPHVSSRRLTPPVSAQVTAVTRAQGAERVRAHLGASTSAARSALPGSPRASRLTSEPATGGRPASSRRWVSGPAPNRRR